MSSLVAPEGTPQIPETRSPKRWIIGDPLPSENLEGQLLPKHLALPIFASDPLSSVAYAPQELLMILTLGWLAFLSFAPWVAAVVVLLLITVVASYRQLIKATTDFGQMAALRGDAVVSVPLATMRSRTRTWARRPAWSSHPPCWSTTS